MSVALPLLKDRLEIEVCYGCPEILNTDVGVQFSSEAFLSWPEEYGAPIGMDGSGRGSG
jgi:hypothetical protein